MTLFCFAFLDLVNERKEFFSIKKKTWLYCLFSIIKNWCYASFSSFVWWLFFLLLSGFLRRSHKRSSQKSRYYVPQDEGDSLLD